MWLPWGTGRKGTRPWEAHGTPGGRSTQRHYSATPTRMEPCDHDTARLSITHHQLHLIPVLTRRRFVQPPRSTAVLVRWVVYSAVINCLQLLVRSCNLFFLHVKLILLLMKFWKKNLPLQILSDIDWSLFGQCEEGTEQNRLENRYGFIIPE